MVSGSQEEETAMCSLSSTLWLRPEWRTFPQAPQPDPGTHR